MAPGQVGSITSGLEANEALPRCRGRLRRPVGVEAVKSFDADLRLSRSNGDIQIAVGHKPSDPLSAGDVGSQAVAIAEDLLHLADIKVLTAKTAPSPKNSTDSSASAPSPKTWSPAGPCTAKAVPCGASENSCTRCRPCCTPPSSPSPTPTRPSKPPAEAQREEGPGTRRTTAGGNHAGTASHRARRGGHPRACRGQRH
jgi:hypothetical protein